MVLGLGRMRVFKLVRVAPYKLRGIHEEMELSGRP